MTLAAVQIVILILPVVITAAIALFLVSGKAWSRNRVTLRDQTPVMFWATIAVMGLIDALTIFMAASMISHA
jgi:uncharacterized MAPEG superfamily protein